MSGILTYEEKYEQLLDNSLTKTYKKANSSTTKIANKKDILDRIQVNSEQECFITLKDHKPNFKSNETTRLINSAKNEIKIISEVLLENLNKELRNELQLQQQLSTGLRKLKTKQT